MSGNSTTRCAWRLTDSIVIRIMHIRMTGVTTSVGTALAAGALALGGSLGVGHDGDPHTVNAERDSSRTAVVIDASRARDGRELVDPRLRDLDADVRLPRTPDEA